VNYVKIERKTVLQRIGENPMIRSYASVVPGTHGKTVFLSQIPQRLRSEATVLLGAVKDLTGIEPVP